ncbi:MAG: flavodoxin family protein [Candidatus Thorarchaeota archaeon]
MKVLVINSSPRKDRGATGGVLVPFIEGMKDAGAEVDIIYTRNLDIGDCRGCFNCWTSTPGKCIQDDDMSAVLEKMATSDLLILATPVYVDGMTGSLKTLLDRTIPILHGRFELRDNHCRHPLRAHVKRGRLALVSVCGFTEIDNFDPLITHVKAVCLNMSREFAGALIRPNPWIIDPISQQGIQVDDIIEAVKQAGYQLISEGEMKKETLMTAAREIIPRSEIVKIMHQSFGDK